MFCGAPQWFSKESQRRNAKKYYDKKTPDDAEPPNRPKKDKGEHEKPSKKDKKSKKDKGKHPKK